MRDMMGTMDHAAMAGMSHQATQDSPPASTGADENPAAAMSGMADMPGMNHGSTRASPASGHAAPEYGPGVDMRVDTPRTNLDDPGIGLRDNGRRVLTYADVRTIGAPISRRRRVARSSCI